MAILTVLAMCWSASAFAALEFCAPYYKKDGKILLQVLERRFAPNDYTTVMPVNEETDDFLRKLDPRGWICVKGNPGVYEYFVYSARLSRGVPSAF